LKKTVEANTETVTLTGLEQDKLYRCTIKAYNTLGKSWDDGTSFRTLKDIDIEAPSNLKIQNMLGKTKATISWHDNSDNEKGFHLYLNNTLKKTVGANVKWTDLTGLTLDTNYTVSIKAYNDKEESNAANINFKTLDDKVKIAHITSPTSNSIFTNDSVTINWDKNDAYKLNLLLFTNEGKFIHTGEVNGTSKTFTLPKNTKSVFVNLASYDASGALIGSERIDLRSTKIAHITSPISNSTLTSDTLTINWDKNGASNIYLSIFGDSGSIFRGYVTGTSKTVTVPTNGEKITVRLYHDYESSDYGSEEIYLRAKK